MRLGQFQPDRAATDDDQVRRLAGLLENRLIGQIGHSVDARNRRHGGARSCGDDETPRLDALAVGFHGPFVDKTRRAANDRHAKPFEALSTVMRGDRGNDAGNVFMHPAEIDAWRLEADAEIRAGAAGLGMARGGNHRLGGHTAGIEAVPAHFALFDQDDRGAKGARRGGSGQSGGATTDNAEIGFEKFGHFRRPQPVSGAMMPLEATDHNREEGKK